MLRVGRVTGRVGSGKFFTGRVGSGQQILKFPRVGSGHGSAKNFQRVGRVKEKCLTGQAGQGKKFHGSDGSKIFQKNCYFSCKFSKIPPKICFLLHEIDVFVGKSVNFMKNISKNLSRVRRVKQKN